jgi:xylulokinase
VFGRVRIQALGDAAWQGVVATRGRSRPTHGDVTRLLGIDVGTSSTKAAVVDAAGGIVARAERPVQLHAPAPGWAEEDPLEWWANVCSLCRELPVAAVSAVGVSGMVPAVVLLDGAGVPPRPSIQQNDARAEREVAELRASLGPGVLARTGSPVTQQSVGPTAMWLARHEPDVWAATRTMLGSYDYVAFRLTGMRAVERNWALESGLYDMATGDWAADICAAAGVDPSVLPGPRRADDVVGHVAPATAAETGLRAGTPVVAGSADHVASAFCAGVVEAGDLLLKLGSAGDVLIASDEPFVDKRLYLDYHLVPGKYLPNGCMAASGSFIRWFQRELAAGAPLERLDAEADGAGAGAGGIVALPYLLGEKTPLNDPGARGAFTGLRLDHTRGHLFRAVLEATAFGFRHHLDVLAERGLAPRRARVTNGGARSRLWKQVVADVTGLHLESLLAHGSELGAAFAAGMGVGAFASWNEIERFVSVEGRIEPDPSVGATYDELYAAYRDLYPALGPVLRHTRAAGLS